MILTPYNLFSDDLSYEVWEIDKKKSALDM